MAYKVTIDGESWLTDELTLDEACAIEEETGTTWHTMEPINSARHAKAIISRFLARRVGSLEMATARVAAMTITEALACMDVVPAKKKAAGSRAPKAATPSEAPASPEASGTSPTT